MIKLHPSPLKKLIALGLMLCPLVSSGQTLLHLRNGYYIAAAGDIAWHNPIRFADEDPLVSFVEQDYDVGLGISTAFGMTCSCWRLEFEGAYRKSNVDKIETAISSEDATGFVRDFTLMVNGYWDVYVPCSWWIFYLGGGLGVSFQERQTCSTLSAFEKTSNTLFAWQGMAGFSYEIIEHVFLNAGYRLVMTAKPRDSTQHADNIVLINNIELGVRIEL
jgi:opacity protein-like surface antigen